MHDVVEGVLPLGLVCPSACLWAPRGSRRCSLEVDAGSVACAGPGCLSVCFDEEVSLGIDVGLCTHLRSDIGVVVLFFSVFWSAAADSG